MTEFCFVYFFTHLSEKFPREEECVFIIYLQPPGSFVGMFLRPHLDEHPSFFLADVRENFTAGFLNQTSLLYPLKSEPGTLLCLQNLFLSYALNLTTLLLFFFFFFARTFLVSQFFFFFLIL